MMKKLLIIFIMLLMVGFILFAGGKQEEGATETGTAEDTGKYHIGFSLDTYANVIQPEMARLLEAECDERGYKLTVTDGERDATKQISDIEAMIQMGVDAIIVLPIDGNAVAPGVDAAYEAGIPIATVLRDMPTSKDKYVCFSGCDDVELGTIAGEWIVDVTDGSGKIAYLSGIPGTSTAENRTKGFHSVVDNYPDIDIVAEQAANYNRSDAMTVMEAILQANPVIDAVWCANDEMAGGAYAAIDAAGREGILLGGANWQKDGYNRLLAGQQHMDITTPPAMVIAAMDACITTLEGGTVGKTLYYPLDLITIENYKDFEDQVY